MPPTLVCHFYRSIFNSVFNFIFLSSSSTGNYNGNHGVATVPQSWVSDSAPAQSQSTSYVHKDNYVGPTPNWDDYWANNAVSTKDGVKYRRHVENGRSLRIEYGGFLPKMNPSVEIDEHGVPIKKAET
jgi:hypothetical protein